MTKAEKLLAKIQNAPQDVRWEELVKFMRDQDFQMKKGRAGSAYRFWRESDSLYFAVHKPHGKKSRVDTGAVKEMLRTLKMI